MTWWDVANEYVPHVTAFGFWLTSLAMSDRLRKANSRAFWTFMSVAIVVWFVLVCLKGLELGEKHGFETRRQEAANAIKREIDVGQDLLEQIANDQTYQHRSTCESQALVDKYAPKIEDW